jgi:hypothetical protein
MRRAFLCGAGRFALRTAGAAAAAAETAGLCEDDFSVDDQGDDTDADSEEKKEEIPVEKNAASARALPPGRMNATKETLSIADANALERRLRDACSAHGDAVYSDIKSADGRLQWRPRLVLRPGSQVDVQWLVPRMACPPRRMPSGELPKTSSTTDYAMSLPVEWLGGCPVVLERPAKQTAGAPPSVTGGAAAAATVPARSKAPTKPLVMSRKRPAQEQRPASSSASKSSKKPRLQ